LPPRILFLNRSYWPDAEATGQLLTELCEDLAAEEQEESGDRGQDQRTKNHEQRTKNHEQRTTNKETTNKEQF
jgi:hypothetical protein